MSTEHNTTSSFPLNNAAVQLLDAGFSIIPIRDLADKKPDLETWKPYMAKQASEDVALHWFTANGKPASPGVAIVCGKVSGNLTVIDFDTRPDGSTLWDRFKAIVDAAHPGLMNNLPLVSTPSGGKHLYVRCRLCEGNTILARDAAGKTLIETRGEGGYVLAPPTPRYTPDHGDIHYMPTISEEERMTLLAAATSLTHQEHRERAAVGSEHESSWEHYNHTVGVEGVLDLLRGEGWAEVRRNATMIHLRRPAKDKGISATLFNDREVPILWCFSTNALPIPSGVGLSPFAVLAHLRYKGDYRAAARALFAQQGRKLTVVPKAPPTQVAPIDTGDEPAWRPSVISHAALRSKAFPALGWVVPNILPEGCTLFVGGPKTGKSWLLLDLAISMEYGQSMFGLEKLEKQDVAYLYLEDGERVAQTRCNKLSAEGSEHLHFFFDWKPFDEGGFDALETYLDEHAATKLVIIDTLIRVRPLSRNGKDLYLQDYAALKGLTDLAHKRHISIIIAHHTRKMASEDAMDLVSGTNGLAGAVDTVMVLQRTRMADQGKLDIMSRLMEDHSYACVFDKDGPRWRIQGDAAAVADTEIQAAIMAFLADAGCAQRPAQIAQAIGHKNMMSLGNILSRMEAADKIVKVGWGKYMLPEEEAPTVSNTNTLTTLTTLTTQGDDPCSFAAQQPSEASVVSVVVKLSTEEDPKHPLPTALMVLTCPSCQRSHTWRRAPTSPDVILCGRCGSPPPQWTQSTPDKY